MKKLSLLLVLSALSVSVLATPEYKATKKIGEKPKTPETANTAPTSYFTGAITYLAMGDDKVYALENTGMVHAFNAKSCGHKDSFMTGMKGASTLAVNEKGEIFVFSTATEEKEVTSGNRKYKRQVSVGVTCKVFDAKGKELRTLKLDALKSAKAAKFIGDKLAVADLQQRALVILDSATGEKTAEIKDGLRLCCGIFDFCVGPDDTIAISNLGAFQVQQYNLDGEKGRVFGKRGKELNDFQGCCNPVSAGYLADGSIVTVEKSPTRIKIYNADGKDAKLIDGVEELVQGCSYIPVAIDGEGNIFLAASQKGYIVKCVPKS